MSRLSDILGVKEEQEFKHDVCGERVYKISGAERYLKKAKGFWVQETDEASLCIMINRPEGIKVIPEKPQLTEQQITAIKGRIAEGWKYIARDIDCEIVFYEVEPEYDEWYRHFESTGDYSMATLPIYDFLKPGECFYLPDLIGGAENE